MTTAIWDKAKVEALPRYSVTNEDSETTYSIPLGTDGHPRIELSFRRAAAASEHTPANDRDIDVEYLLKLVAGEQEEAVEALMAKQDLITLQKLLVRVLEHSRLRRAGWLAESQSISRPGADPGAIFRPVLTDIMTQ